jgi:hypothetical protein
MQFGFLQESVDIELYFSNALHFNWSINRSNKHKMKNQKIAHCPNNSKIKYQNHRKRTIRSNLLNISNANFAFKTEKKC